MQAAYRFLQQRARLVRWMLVLLSLGWLERPHR